MIHFQAGGPDLRSTQQYPAELGFRATCLALETVFVAQVAALLKGQFSRAPAAPVVSDGGLEFHDWGDDSSDSGLESLFHGGA